MIIDNVQQGSEEWFALKLGKPSASNFDKIVQMNGKPSKQREKYMCQLAGERVCGKKGDCYTNAHMERGVELEGEARTMYEMLNNIEVQTVGVVYQDERKRWLCSPDGLVEGGGLEIKNPSIAVHVKYLLDGGLPSEYFQQVQGSLMVTGLGWWDFVSHYPGIKPLIIRVRRDEAFIKALQTEIEKFCDELDAVTERIK